MRSTAPTLGWLRLLARLSLSLRPRIGSHEIDEKPGDRLRSILHREMTAIFEDMQCRAGDGGMESMRPVETLPSIVPTPYNLHPEIAQFVETIRYLQGMSRIVMGDLMLEKAALPDRTGDEIEIGIQRAGRQSLPVGNGRKQPLAEMGSVIGIRFLHQTIQSLFHLPTGAPRGPAIEAAYIDQRQRGNAFRGEDAEALGDGTTDIVGDDMRPLQPPMRHQPFEDRDLPGNRGIDFDAPRSLGEPVAEQIVDMDHVAGIDEKGDDLAPNIGRGRGAVDESHRHRVPVFCRSMNAVCDADAIDQDMP